MSGKLTTPDQVAWAMCAGVDLVVSTRGFMLAQAASIRRTVTSKHLPRRNYYPTLDSDLAVYDKA